MYEIDVIIDALTPCLLHEESGQYVNTVVKPITKNDLTELKTWNATFNWSLYFNRPEILMRKLMVEGSDRIEGALAMQIQEGFIEVILVESAPWNIKKPKHYAGVGGHLFAIACKKSCDHDFDGVIAFNAKTRLIQHYQKTIHAELIGGTRMIVEEEGAALLLKTYYKEGAQW